VTEEQLLREAVTSQLEQFLLAAYGRQARRTASSSPPHRHQNKSGARRTTTDAGTHNDGMAGVRSKEGSRARKPMELLNSWHKNMENMENMERCWAPLRGAQHLNCQRLCRSGVGQTQPPSTLFMVEPHVHCISDSSDSSGEEPLCAVDAPARRSSSAPGSGGCKCEVRGFTPTRTRRTLQVAGRSVNRTEQPTRASET